MLHQLQRFDTDLFLFLNGLHTPWADRLMYWVTATQTWIPLYVMIVVALIWQYKRRAVAMIAAMVLSVALADQTTSSLLKPWVERLRPCYVEYLQSQVHLVVEGCGGKYGFASSHAANSFALAMVLWLLVGQRFRWVGWVFFSWAALVAYSRVYVGVHYPLDIVVGALIGVLIAKIVVGFLRYLKMP
ncbi:MAG: phosphatase PAP2 family protein [Runella sp.]